VLTERDPLVLHQDRFFDPDLQVRRIARELFEETHALPLVCPHGHVDARLLSENKPFPEPAELLIKPDHYILRMLYSRGIALERLGIPPRDGASYETDPRRIWQTFAEHYFLFRGTPTGAWLDFELAGLLGVAERLNGESAQRIYDQVLEKLATPAFLPRALFESFNIEVLATTDKATDTLEQHRALQGGWNGRVIPTFRPDALFRIAAPGWHVELETLQQITGRSVGTYAQFAEVLEERRLDFKSMGATATDHGVQEPYTERLSVDEADRLFQRALLREAESADQRRFEAHMLMEMARMSIDDGLVMQLHPGSLRDHNEPVAARFGPDLGGDIPLATEFTRNLRPLLNTYGNDPRFTLIVFTLDESTYSRELAPLAGHYPALRLGPPWWFFDSIEGMQRFRQRTTETAGIYNTAGFNDDTRAFCSIPARHDLCRRVDANYLAGLVTRHIIAMSDARELAQAMAYGLVKETYRL
jgi:glucuronate isomerase